MQKIRLGNKVYLMDTPGVFPKMERDESKHAMVNVKDPSRIKEPDVIALEIIERVSKKDPKVLEKIYGVKSRDDPMETIEAIAIKFNWLLKGAKPNIDYVSRKIISDWQRGKIII